jgi:hypothetical protein
VLPPYTELVRFDAGPALGEGELRQTAGELLRRHLSRRPRENPFERFAVQLERTLPELLERELDDYHAYAFATVRMAGSGFEIAASHIEWLLEERAAEAAASMRAIVDGCKALSFRLARRRPFDPGPLTTSLAGAWNSAMLALAEAVP